MGIEIDYHGDMQRLRLDPGDIGILRFPGKLSREAVMKIRAEWMRLFPDNDHRCLVLDGGVEFTVLSPTLIETFEGGAGI